MSSAAMANAGSRLTGHPLHTLRCGEKGRLSGQKNAATELVHEHVEFYSAEGGFWVRQSGTRKCPRKAGALEGGRGDGV